ncbi:hypothetical protein G6F60_014985 [Rhizopus arrhizus]|nr:hypothetical protein G6F60_014985 [Rhizopus arrhizus]
MRMRRGPCWLLGCRAPEPGLHEPGRQRAAPWQPRRARASQGGRDGGGPGRSRGHQRGHHSPVAAAAPVQPQIVLSHGGRIGAESRDGLTHFRVDLPRETPRAGG